MTQTMEQMLAERTMRIQANNEAQASLTQYHDENPFSDLRIRSAWTPVALPRTPNPHPDRARFLDVRASWKEMAKRPLIVGAFQGSPDTPGGFWSWIRYTGSLAHIVRDYVGKWQQHLDFDAIEIQMVTHESALYFKGLPTNGTTDSWAALSAAPCSLYNNGSILTEGSSGLERFDAASNACYGIDKNGKPYFDDTGLAPARDRARLKYNGSIIWLEQ